MFDHPNHGVPPGVPAARWFACPRPNPAARLRLVCFPQAGGNDLLFRTWPQLLPPEIEVCAALLPGRGTRWAEPPFTRISPLASAIVDGMADVWRAPFALFGFSTGARVAYEVARTLRERGGALPALLAVAGRAAPHCPERDPMHALADAQLIERMRRLGGTPEAVLRDAELMAMFLPIVRADLTVNEAEPHRAEPPLGCPIAAFGGTSDERCTPDQLVAWRDHTVAAFHHQLFPGGHFFLQSQARDVLAALGRALAGAVPP